MRRYERLLERRSFCIGVSGASFVSLLQTLQVSVPAAPNALGVAVVAFSFASAAGIGFAFAIDNRNVRRRRRVSDPKDEHWFALCFAALLLVSFLTGVIALLVHVYPGHLAWVSFAIGAALSIALTAAIDPEDHSDDDDETMGDALPSAPRRRPAIPTERPHPSPPADHAMPPAIRAAPRTEDDQ